jgi:hypothetical protein
MLQVGGVGFQLVMVGYASGDLDVHQLCLLPGLQEQYSDQY